MDGELREAMRQARRRSGLSFARFAQLANFAEGHLRSVKNGRRTLTSDIAAAYDRVLETGGLFGTMLHTAADTARISDVDRRELLRLSSLLAVLAAGPAPHGDYDTELDERAGDRLWNTFTTSRTKPEVMLEVRAQLTLISAMLDRPLSASARRRTNRLAANLLQLSGEVLYDANRYDDAASCYTAAVAAAREASEPDLWACALTRHAFISLADKNDRDAVLVLEPAATLAARGDGTLSTRFWVASVQAKAYAGLGRASDCLTALDAAEQVRDPGTGATNGGWLRFDDTRLGEERGACLVTLKRPTAAEPVLLDALGRLPSGRRRGAVLADLVAVGAQLHDPERVVHYGAEAMRVASVTRSGYVAERLAAVRPQLEPILGVHPVAELDKQIRALAVRRPMGA
jgi:tetratricopeptide (TPR) repeat protein